MPTINHSEIAKKYPWLFERDQDCILSPDTDGLLCGLLMSSHFGWQIRGFYDGKILILKKGIKPRNCVFLDMEIFRKGVRSVGQHMVMFDKEKPPAGWENFDDCISANNLRNFDFKNDFKEKYPFGTIHLLLSLLSEKHKLEIPKTAICPLLYADGTFKNQFNYPENCISWLRFLDADREEDPLQKIFINKHYSTYELMTALKDLFAEFHTIGGGKRGGDKIKISDSGGRLMNIDEKDGKLKAETINQAAKLLEMLAAKTGWEFISEHWHWGPYDMFNFKKSSKKPGKARYNELFAEKPLSLAIISGLSIEYTLDPDGLF